MAIVLSSSDEKIARAKLLGCAHGLNYKTVPDWDRVVLDLTGGVGVDMVLETGGGTLARSIIATRREGIVHLIGALVAGAVDPLALLMSGVIVRGVMVGSRDMLADMIRAVASNRLEPVIDDCFDLMDAAAAYRRLASGAHFGKIVITLS